VTAFLDSSALVKRHVPEQGADLVASLASAVVSALARVEVPAALHAKVRLGEVEPEEAAQLLRAFEADLIGPQAVLAAVPLTSEVLTRAARAVAVHPLRTLDAIQLASAIVAREADPSLATFVTFDRALARTAAAEGFSVLP
jgi:hypothetical protein